MKKIEEFDFVEVLTSIGKDFEEDKIGEVVNVDGAYILVKLNISGVEVELYPNELRLLEDNESDMAYFQRNMWRGLRPAIENANSEYNWLTAGYLREVDWEAAQEENVTTKFEFVDVSLVEHPTDPDAWLPGKKPTKWGKFATKLNLLNDRCQKKPERIIMPVIKNVSPMSASDLFEAVYHERNYDRANKIVK